ncbi:MAG: PrsW family intramembrane metalloprotease [Clostridia bacterium]|nr:PrsW family intramembrane metalloprotease [Clostridia bacterium]
MKGEGSLTRARITYMFKETFRAHSKDEYREFLTRGLGENKGGITGTYPWLYVRMFFILFILFTVNTVVLRFTGNTLYFPTITLLAGITFTFPFMTFLFELYPKRDLSVLKLFGILVIGGTVAGVLTQVGYALIKLDNPWYSALISGLVEEVSKAAVAIAAILVMRNKNSYACFLIAAAVGTGFSVMEDMGYMFFYSDSLASQYGDIRSIVYLFIDRGFSTFCTHILWTGLVGLAYGFAKGKGILLSIVVLIGSIIIHSFWNLPLDGWMHSGLIAICTILTVLVNIVAVRKSLFSTMSDEFDIARINDNMIREAKEMGEQMRFTNAANLTFSLTCTILSIILLALCCLPIGMEKMHVDYADKQEFLSAVQGGYNVTVDWSREYDPNGKTVEERKIHDGDELVLSYVVQEVQLTGYEGVYYYGYYVGDRVADSIYLMLENVESRIPCVEYTFGDDTAWAFEVNDDYEKYTYNKSDGSVSAIIDAEAFEGYNLLIALVASAVAVAGACGVILFAFSIKLRRVRDDG